jgi:TolB-like protein
MLVLAMALTTSVAVAAPQTVYFVSGDGKTDSVQGSVRRVEYRVRINAQLADSASGAQI